MEEPEDRGGSESPEPGEGSTPIVPVDRDAASHLRHELRTPLGQIIGYAELLQELVTDDGNEHYIVDLERIVAAGRRMLGMVDRIGRDDIATAPPAETEQRDGGAGSPPAAEPDEDATLRLEGGAFGELLVVDDNEMNRDMLSRRLAARGYRVSQAADGREALDHLADHPCDVVLLDIEMPGMSGLEVLRELRRSRSMAELPVIMATARDASDDTVQALGLGANDYVTKPLDLPVVLARVATQLSLKRATERIRHLVDELDARNRFIRATFGRYVSDEVVASLLASPEGLALGGERRTVTILLADLRGFTPTADRLTPEQVVRLLNNYLGTMAEVVGQFAGTVDEFIGDSILALFGAPLVREDDADRAVACAVAMQRAMAEVNRRNREDGLPEVSMGVAVNSGEVVVGNIGSERRTKYGVVGSPINLAARIQACTMGGQVLVSHGCVERLAAPLVVAETTTLSVKGFRDPVVVHEVRGVGAPYDLSLPASEDAPVDLVEEIPVSFRVLGGAEAEPVAVRGSLVRLSRRAAEVRAPVCPDPFSDLCIRLLDDDGREGVGEVYGKVTGETALRGTFVTAFSSLPAALERFLQGRMED